VEGKVGAQIEIPKEIQKTMSFKNIYQQLKSNHFSVFYSRISQETLEKTLHPPATDAEQQKQLENGIFYTLFQALSTSTATDSKLIPSSVA
jgi:hypothetical protein